MSKQWKVLISKSHDIYLNLAWEDWLYRKVSFTNQNLLLLWRNTPCIVIGRYQNPWKEANVDACKAANIPIARRFSGGGTVYHDMGNINFTFMTERSQYNRKRNLEFIADLLRGQYNIDAVVNPRDDIVVDGSLKVSGTAAKLGRLSAYHHCTLLVNANKENLRAALSPKKKGIRTNATESVPSPTVNLVKVLPDLSCEGLMDEYAVRYADLNGNFNPDEWISRVEPSESDYPGITKVAAELRTEQFIWSNTPKFSIVREFVLPENDKNSSVKISLDILVEKGAVVESTIDGNISAIGKTFAQDFLAQYHGMPFEAVRMAVSLAWKDSLKTGTIETRKLEQDFIRHCILRALSLQE